MTSYDPVGYSDRAHFHSPADGHYDDPDESEKHANGNGVYNDYTVEIKPKEYRPTFRFFCCKFQNTRKVKFVICGALVVFCLAMILVIVSAVAHHNQMTQSKQPKKYGLIAYGPDSEGMISFDHLDHKSYMSYFNRLETALHDYSVVKQMADVENKYITCNDSMSAIPSGKVCMQIPLSFGLNCQHMDMYGINEERPCVLLVLQLEEDFVPKPFNFTNDQNKEIHQTLGDRISNTSVGISCEGKTPADKDLIGTDKHQGEVIDYNPRKGFPIYYFLSKGTEGYINPAVMVQFNTIPTHQTVTVKCTAWAENFNSGDPENSSKYSTEFTFRLQ